MPLHIIRNDITGMDVDVIVNSAHPTPEVGGGVDFAIHQAAGPELIAARRKIGDIATGTAFITPGFKLPAKYVVHTVGPIWREGKKGQREQLADCYKNSLRLAVENECDSIAFPLISAGVFACPAEIAIATAVQAIREFLTEHEINVYLVIFNRKDFKLPGSLMDEVQGYLDEKLVRHRRKESIFDQEACKLDSLMDEMGFSEEECLLSAPAPIRKRTAVKKPRALSDLLNETEDTFSEALLRLIDAKGKTDPEVYKRANVDRKHFSKIRNNPGYQPSKATALALAVALELNLDETKDFIGRAGYAISHSSKTDIIVEYFIKRKDYDIFTINETLFAFGQPCLG